MVDINPAATSSVAISGVSEPKTPSLLVNDASAVREETVNDVTRERRVELTKEELESSAEVVEAVVTSVTQDTSLSFRVEEDLSRMVVAVRAVGSDEIIRQFPPEEFITVAKHIAAQNPDLMDEDYLKGILFDQRI